MDGEKGIAYIQIGKDYTLVTRVRTDGTEIRDYLRKGDDYVKAFAKEISAKYETELKSE